jgi:hypothetical protein
LLQALQRYKQKRYSQWQRPSQQATEQASRKLWHPSLLKKPVQTITIILQLNVENSFAITDISF